MMKRLLTASIAIAAALVVAACGGGSGNGGGATAHSGPPTTVSVRQFAGMGSALADPSGKALYTPNLEAGGKIACTGPCTSFWRPVTVRAGRPSAPAGAGKLGVITRPDGSRQVTDGGRPLYTFTEDAAGHATGDGFTDAFGGHHFTWHLVRSGAGATSGGGAANAAGGGARSSGGIGY